MKLNKAQTEILNRAVEQSERSFQDARAKLAKAMETPGELAYHLQWNAAELMLVDDLRNTLASWAKNVANPEFCVTLEEREADLRQRLVDWSPSRSTNPVANLHEEVKREVLRKLLEHTQVLIQAAKWADKAVS